MELVSIDPALNVAGIAFWDFQPTHSGEFDHFLSYATEVRNPIDGRGPRAWDAMATAVDREIQNYSRHFQNPMSEGYEVALEWLRVYKRKTKYQKDVLQVAGSIGALSTILHPEGWHLYEPKTWTRSRPKKPNHARIARSLRDFEADNAFEMTCLQLENRAIEENEGSDEHVMDAIGVGLYHLKRL